MHLKGEFPVQNGVLFIVSIILLFSGVGSEYFEISLVPTLDANTSYRPGSGHVSMLDANTTFVPRSGEFMAEEEPTVPVPSEFMAEEEPTVPVPSEFFVVDALEGESGLLSLLLRRSSDCDNATLNKTINDTDPCNFQPKSYQLNYSTMFLILIPLLVSIFLLCVGYCIRQRIW